MPNSQKPIVRLFIPQLFQALARWNKDCEFQPESPYLSRILCQFSRQESSFSTFVESLFSSIGLEENAELPIAHYRYQNQKNLNETIEISDMLVCADPIHLVVGMNDITLTTHIDDLTVSEVQELLDLLNQHFSQDNIKFFYGSNKHWYLSLASQETMNSTPFEAVLKQKITKSSITMGDRNWQAIQTEIQMLLHSSELNRQRELMGLPTVNGLWLWGGGAPLKKGKKLNLVMGGTIDDGLMAKNLAKAAECDWKPLPTASETINWEATIKGDTHIVLDQLLVPAIDDQLEAFQQALLTIDAVIKPLFNLWQENQIALMIDSCDGYQIKPIRTPAWKFWLKPQSLVNIAQTLHKTA